MSTLKELFEGGAPFSAQSLEEIGAEVESGEFLEEASEDRTRFIPDVNYAEPREFVRFGLAEQYYDSGFRQIAASYPFDGSLKERTEWRNHNPAVNVFILDELYPKGTGYITFSAEGYGSIATAGGPLAILLSEPDDKEYISLSGGPHSGTLYQVGKLRQNNLRFGGSEGNTVEFWMQKSTFPDLNEIVFDAWTSGSVSGSADWGRFVIEMGDDSGEQWLVTYQSGTDGHQYATFDDASITDGDWHHYAFTIVNTDTNLKFKYYRDGTFIEQQDLGTPIGAVSGNIIASLGAALSEPYVGYGATVSNLEGWGKCSASFDDFRFWKSARSSEEIGKYWFTNVYGGTDSDDANVNLGVYYKFNEGITQVASVDSKVLDYSGRLNTGSWTGYTDSSRNTGSAMVSSSAATFERPDPIMYLFHPSVTASLEEYKLKGREFDYANGGSLYGSMPQWIRDEDARGQLLRDMTQVVSVYLDNLHLQIEQLPKVHALGYQSQSLHNPVFTQRLLASEGLEVNSLFSEATILELYGNRDDNKEFQNSVVEVKNLILRNLYNNLIHIYKSKGTEKGYRNALRCFGIDEDLVRINVYSDGANFKIGDKRRLTSEPVTYLDFYDADHFGAVLTIDPDNSAASSSFLTSSVTDPFTYEVAIRFPKKFDADSEFFFSTPFVTSSLFGIGSVASGSGETTAVGSNEPSFQAVFVRESTKSPHGYFMLTSSLGYFPTLTSSVFYDVYDGSDWIVSVKKRGGTNASGSSEQSEIIFEGAHASADVITDSFLVTGTVAQNLTGTFAPYVGAHRTNITGSQLIRTDIQVAGVRFWDSLLSQRETHNHAADILNYGTKDPYSNRVYGTPSEQTEAESLRLNWVFDQVTQSDGSGEITVNDFSSGSTVRFHRPGKGFFFSTNSTGVINKSYAITAKNKLPEVLSGLDEISVLDSDESRFVRSQRPLTTYYSFEKSLYANVSSEMLRLFASVVDYGSLIGQPVNRYRSRYKGLDYMRDRFFERVSGTGLDLNRFVDFYKWIDGAVSEVLLQLTPASARTSRGVVDVVESHVFERSKYQNRIPTLKRKTNNIEGVAQAAPGLTYNWQFGHAPVGLTQSENCLWWQTKAERDQPPLSSSASEVNESRSKIFETVSASHLRKQARLSGFSVDIQNSLVGGRNSGDGAQDGIVSLLSSYTSPTLVVSASSVGEGTVCSDLSELDLYKTLTYIVTEE